MGRVLGTTIIGAANPGHQGPEYDLYGRMRVKVGSYEVSLLICRNRDKSREWRVLEETTKGAIGRGGRKTRKLAVAAAMTVLLSRTEEQVRSVIEGVQLAGARTPVRKGQS